MADLLSQKEYTPRALEQGGSILFYISLGLFFVIGAGLGGLFLLNKAQKEARETLVEEVDQKQSNLRTDLLDQIFLLEQRLKNLRTLLSEHVFSSNAIALIEQDTLPQARFFNFNFDAVARKLDMTGEAINYAMVARQIGIFERDPQVESVEFGGLSIGGNNLAGFKISIIFKRNFLHLH